VPGGRFLIAGESLPDLQVARSQFELPAFSVRHCKRYHDGGLKMHFIFLLQFLKAQSSGAGCERRAQEMPHLTPAALRKTCSDKAFLALNKSTVASFSLHCQRSLEQTCGDPSHNSPKNNLITRATNPPHTIAATSVVPPGTVSLSGTTSPLSAGLSPYPYRRHLNRLMVPVGAVVQ
jgi:hypothetical protein